MKAIAEACFSFFSTSPVADGKLHAATSVHELIFKNRTTSLEYCLNVFRENFWGKPYPTVYGVKGLWGITGRVYKLIAS
jgi:hypothetical protein